MRVATRRRETGERLLALFAAVATILSLVVIGAGPAFGGPPPSGPDTITVDGVSHQATQKSGPVSHFETSDTDPTAASTSRNVWEGHGSEHLPCENGIHWVDNTELLTISNCLEGEPQPEPDRATASVDGACVERRFVVQIATSNATVDADLDGNGSIGSGESGLTTGSHDVSADVGDSISWSSAANSGAEFAGAAPSGSLTVLDCAPDQEPEPDRATASVDGACVGSDFKARVETLNSTVGIDLDGVGGVESDEQGLTTGDYAVTAPVGESIVWNATANSGAAFTGTPPSGTIAVLECDQEPPDVEVVVTPDIECEIIWTGEGFDLFGVVDFDTSADGVEKIDIFSGGQKVATWTPGGGPVNLEAWSYTYEITYRDGFDGEAGGHFDMDREWFNQCSCPSGTIDLSNTGVLKQTDRTSRAGEPASPVSIAGGRYHIYLASFDDHSTKPSQDQNQEMWALANASLGGSPSWISPATGDLPESVNFMSYHVTAEGAVSVPPFNNQTLWTVHRGSAASPNSIEPVCAELVPVDVGPEPTGRIEVTKTASSVVVESGDAVTYTVLVENVSDVDVTIEVIEDDTFGEIAPTKSASVSSTNCTVPQPLSAQNESGDSYTCTFTAVVTGSAGSDHTNIVTVSGEDEHDNPVSDRDSATVSIAAPVDIGSIEVSKSAGVDSVTAGSPVTFTIEVENTSGVAVTIQNIVDDVFGEIAPSTSSEVLSTTCAVPADLAPDDGTDGSGEDFYSCQFVGVVEGEPDGVHTNEVEVSGVDARGTTVSDTGIAHVTIDEVGGIVITPPEQPAGPVTPVDIPDIVPGADVEAEELPFTGIQSDRLLGLGILLLGSGILLLRWKPRREAG